MSVEGVTSDIEQTQTLPLSRPAKYLNYNIAYTVLFKQDQDEFSTWPPFTLMVQELCV